MDSSSGQHQEMGMLVCSKAQQERKARPQPEEALKCPRCDSSNTKFCYYNNYSLSQPRYFCKSCRRYWTKGGMLRNVPVGGGCRKNKRSSPPSSSSSSATSSKRSQDDHRPFSTGGGLPPLSYDSNDLSLAFARLQKQTDGQLGFDHHHHFPILENPTNTHLGNPSISNSSSPAFLDALRSGFLDTTQNSFQNLCYGFENGGVGVSSSGEMLMPYGGGETMKRENENKVLWGFPWQQLDNGDHHGSLVVGDIDSGKESWNGFSSSWHGLLNSPLM